MREVGTPKVLVVEANSPFFRSIFHVFVSGNWGIVVVNIRFKLGSNAVDVLLV